MMGVQTLGPVSTTTPSILPIITAAPGVRSKVATKAARNLTSSPLNVLCIGDSNWETGDFTQNSRGYGSRFAVRLQEYLNAPGIGFNTGKNPGHAMYYRTGVLITTRQGGNPWFQKTANSSNWCGVAGPFNQYCGGSTSFVKSTAGGYLAWRIDRRDRLTAGVYDQGPEQHSVDRLATRVKIIGSAGGTGGFGWGNGATAYDMAAGYSGYTTVDNVNHGNLTVQFWNVETGLQVGSDTTVTRIQTGSTWYWDGYTSPYITLPTIGTAPYIEIRVIQPAGSRNAVSGLWFDDGSEMVRVIDLACAGASFANCASSDVDTAGVIQSKTDQNCDQFGANVGFAYEAPHVVRGVSPTGVSNTPIFSNGLDYLVCGLITNDTNAVNHLKFKGHIESMVTEIIARQADAVIVFSVPPPRGRGNVAALDTYISTGITIDSQSGVTWGLMVNAFYLVQAQFPNNVAILDWNAAYNRQLGVSQVTATQMSNSYNIYNAGDANHFDPWFTNMEALATAQFISGRI